MHLNLNEKVIYVTTIIWLLLKNVMHVIINIICIKKGVKKLLNENVFSCTKSKDGNTWIVCTQSLLQQMRLVDIFGAKK